MYHRAHRELSDRLEAAVVDEQVDMAMIPIKPEAMTLQTNLQELPEEVLKTQTTALQHENTTLHAKIRALEATTKKQSILTKSLEIRLNKLEPPPPDYGMPSLTRTDKKIH